MEQLGSDWTDFHGVFVKHLSRNLKVLLKSDKNNRYCTRRPMYSFDNISLSSSKNEKYFKTKYLRKSEHILCSITFFKSYLLRDNVEKYCRAGQATGHDMAHAHIACWITKATPTLKLRNTRTYRFSIAKMVRRTYLSVKRYTFTVCLVDL